MCVLYVSCMSKVRPRTFGCVDIGGAVFCEVQIDPTFRRVLSKQSASWFVWI